MNTAADTSPEELSKFNDFYSNVHMREVVANNPGFSRATRYKLCEPDPRGDLGPRWLAVYEMGSEEAATGYIARSDGRQTGAPSTPGPAAWQSFQPWWRLLWGRFAPKQGELGAGGAPYLYFVAMNVPPDTNNEGLQEFNDFYTKIHVPEVVKMSDFVRGHRYQLYREFLHPASGCPRFLAVYEADENSLKRGQKCANPGSRGRLSSGPPSWEARHLWRRSTGASIPGPSPDAYLSGRPAARSQLACVERERLSSRLHARSGRLRPGRRGGRRTASFNWNKLVKYGKLLVLLRMKLLSLFVSRATPILALLNLPRKV
jgi:hypothetical protein